VLRRSSTFSCAALLVGLILAAGQARAQSDAGAPQPDAGTTAAQSDAGAPQPTEPPAANPLSAEARAAFERGVELSLEEQWGEALREFRRSLELVPRASTAFNVASTLVRIGRHVEAVAAYELYLRIADPAAEGARFQNAQAQLAVERRAVATLVLNVTPVEAQLRVDGQVDPSTGATRAVLVDPGTHTIEVTAPRHRAFTTQLRVAAGERSPVRVSLEAVTSATLEVVPNVERATVRVDGAAFGRGPRSISAGPHEIVVECPEYEPFRRRVTLLPEASLRVDASLSRRTRPPGANPVLWTAVGVGAAAVITAIVLGVTLSSQTPEFQTSTGIVIQGLSR
jgi:hypothetical protein